MQLRLSLAAEEELHVCVRDAVVVAIRREAIGLLDTRLEILLLLRW